MVREIGGRLLFRFRGNQRAFFVLGEGSRRESKRPADRAGRVVEGGAVEGQAGAFASAAIR